MNLEFLTREGTDKLAREVASNLPAYRSGKTDVLILPSDCRVSRLEVVDPPDLLEADGEPKTDAAASKLIFQWLSKLTPVQASDARLWVMLTHRHFSSYVYKRWGKNLASVTGPEALVLDRWFFRGQGARTFVHNALSRLWWFGYLTCDQRNANPFELTEILLSLQDIQTAFLERSLGRCKPLLMAVLHTIKQHQVALRQTPNSGDVIQEWAKEIRIYGGAFMLDAVPQERLTFVLERMLRERLVFPVVSSAPLD